MNAKGSVFKYPDNVDTDVIIPARHLNTQDAKELASHCMEDIDKDFVKNVKDGDIIVGGWNFGCGSSREHAPLCIKTAGISVVIAKSFARIFYRNSINIGLPIMECPEAVDAISAGDTVRVDFSMTGLDYLKSKARNVNLGQKDSTRKWDPYITITLADNTQYPLRGLVDFADPQVDPETGTFSVRAEMANPDRILLPGQFTKVKLLLDVRENATVVPLKSVIIEKGGAFVFVMRRDSTVERRFIELGPEFQNQVVVERGLVPGETIVVEGYHKLSPGMKVKVNNALLKKEDEEQSQTPDTVKTEK